MKQQTSSASDGVPCSSFCHPSEKCAITESGICDAVLGAEMKWNSEADEYNQWDNLGQDERDDLITAFIETNVKNQAP